MTAPLLIDKLVEFDEDHTDSAEGPKLVIKHTQEIPDEHIAQLKREKIDTLHTPTGDFYRVASIPTSVVDKWKTEGFDIHQASLKEIMLRLQKEQMDAFITTNKRLF